MTLADRIISLHKNLNFTGSLPPGIRIMNPFESTAPEAFTTFYKKYYNDNQTRHLILGINPGRFGAAITGVPFTDTKRLVQELEIPYDGPETHEPSSVFIYEMIRSYGGPEHFFNHFYISSICPLGFTITKEQGKEVNYNYYDDLELATAVKAFITDHLKKTLSLGVSQEICICFGRDKNLKFLERLNQEHKFFKRIVALEHPRYIIQYRSKEKNEFIEKYLETFRMVRTFGQQC